MEPARNYIQESLSIKGMLKVIYYSIYVLYDGVMTKLTEEKI